MLNSPDWKITQIVMNCQYTAPDHPFAVKVSFLHRTKGKTTTLTYTSEKSYLEVSQQARRQLPLREYYTVIDEPKPAKSKAPIAAPVKKGGKKKS